MMDKETHKQYSLKFAEEVVESLNKSVQAEHPMPKDILAEIFEKSDEEFLLSSYAVHKEFETKAGRQPQTLEEYTKEFYREKTEEEVKQAEQFQDEMDTYLRHNGPIGSRARTKPKLTLFAKLQKFIHKLFS
jgi:uncharacterized protein with WD repeat